MKVWEIDNRIDYEEGVRSSEKYNSLFSCTAVYFSLSNQGTATSSGTNLQATGFSMSSGQSVCSQTFAPSYLPVDSVGLNQPNVNPTSSLSSQPTSNLAAAQSSGVPSLANWNIPKELFALNPQLFVTSQISEPGFSVAGVLPPVPGYIVNMVKKNIFVDFVLLRPANLDKLPPPPRTSGSSIDAPFEMR